MISILNQCYKFKVALNTRLGRACVATSKITKGEIICKMNGPLITLKEFSEKYELNDCTPLQIDEDIFVDLTEPYVCFNHSCNPNAGIRNNGILFALRAIEPGEEVMYDYSTTVDDLWWQMQCNCKSSKCRKIIGDFQSIPHSRKEYFLKEKALTAHIMKTYYTFC